MAAQKQLPHIRNVDIDDSGLLTEVAIVKEIDDGTIHYINISNLADIEKARLKKILLSPHADKYALWELLSQATLSNGMNALDFFHYNFIKVKRAKGSKPLATSGLGTVTTKADPDTLPGAEFSNAMESEIDVTGMRK